MKNLINKEKLTKKKKWLIYYWCMFSIIIGYQLIFLIYPFFISSNKLIYFYILLGLNLPGWLIFIEKVWNETNKYIYLFLGTFVFLVSVNVYLYYFGYLRFFQVVVLPEFHYLPFLLISYLIYKDERINYLTKKMSHYLGNRNMTKAKKYLDKYFKEYPDELVYFSQLGYIYSAENKYNSILEDFTEIISSLNNVELSELENRELYAISVIYYYYAEAHFSHKLYQKALRYYTKAYDYCEQIEDNQDFIKNIYIKTMFFLGVCYSQEKDYKNSVKYYKKFQEESNKLNLSFDKQNFNYFYACSLYKNREYDKAEKIFFKLIEEGYPEDILWNYKHLISLYSMKNDQKNMWQYLIRATEKDLCFFIHYVEPDILTNEDKEKLFSYVVNKTKKQEKNIEVFTILIYLLFLLGNEEEAKKIIGEMELKYPEHNDIYYWKIIYYLRKGLGSKARETYKVIAEKDADFINSYDWVEVNENVEEVQRLLDAPAT